jgi:hypothetical protein
LTMRRLPFDPKQNSAHGNFATQDFLNFQFAS